MESFKSQINLILYNWKCYRQENFELQLSKSIFILGQNGVGKTSLWLAIYSLIQGEVPRGIKLDECISKDAQYFGISTNQNGLFLTGKSNSNYLEIKHEKSNFFENIKLFEYRVYENEYFSWNREQRIKYYDSILTSIYGKVYYTALQNLHRALRSKAEILRKYKNVQDFKNLDNTKKILIHYNQIIAKQTQVLWFHRHEYFWFLKGFLKDFCFDLGIPNNKLILNYKQTSFRGVLEVRNNSTSKQLDEVVILSELNSLLENELKSGKSLYGAHKDDVELLINDIDLNNYLSRGQIRMWIIFQKIIAIKLLKKNMLEKVVKIWFFLDDVFNEIDNNYENLLVSKWALVTDKLFFTGVRVPEIIKNNLNYQIILL